MLAPVVLFAYNRPQHLQRTIDALKNNTLANETLVYAFIDGPKSGQEEKVDQVFKILSNLTGFKEVHIKRQTRNQGLGISIINGVTEIFEKHDKIIVLEDDLLTSPHYLQFINDALTLYENDSKVMSCVGYNYPISVSDDTYFLNNSDCLGWATWKDRWAYFEPDAKKLYTTILERGLKSRFDLDNSYPYLKLLRKVVDGKNSSWAIRWYASVFLIGGLSLYPGKSLVKHIGNDEGTNMNGSNFLDTEISYEPLTIQKIPLIENKAARKELAKYFRKNGRLLGLIWNKLSFQIQRKLFRK